MALGTMVSTALLAVRRWQAHRRLLRRRAILAWRAFAQGHEHPHR
jgi:hypothetical protein